MGPNFDLEFVSNLNGLRSDAGNCAQMFEQLGGLMDGEQLLQMVTQINPAIDAARQSLQGIHKMMFNIAGAVDAIKRAKVKPKVDLPSFMDEMAVQFVPEGKSLEALQRENFDKLMADMDAATALANAPPAVEDEPVTNAQARERRKQLAAAGK